MITAISPSLKFGAVPFADFKKAAGTDQQFRTVQVAQAELKPESPVWKGDEVFKLSTHTLPRGEKPFTALKITPDSAARAAKRLQLPGYQEGPEVKAYMTGVDIPGEKLTHCRTFFVQKDQVLGVDKI